MTAKEFLYRITEDKGDGMENICHAMREFAKYHVERALKEKVMAMSNLDYEDGSLSISELGSCTKNAYPLENIK